MGSATKTAHPLPIIWPARKLRLPNTRARKRTLSTGRIVDRLEPRAAAIVRAISLDGEERSATRRRLSMTGGAVRVALHRALKRLSTLAQETLR